MSQTLEKRIAIELFNEYHNRIGSLISRRSHSRRHHTENIIAFGATCISIGRDLERDALKEYLAGSEPKPDATAQDAKQSGEDAYGVEQHLSSPQSQP